MAGEGNTNEFNWPDFFEWLGPEAIQIIRTTRGEEPANIDPLTGQITGTSYGWILIGMFILIAILLLRK